MKAARGAVNSDSDTIALSANERACAVIREEL